jgi:hypothetical protein
MPIFNSLAKIAAKPLPRIVTPQAHAVIDYASVAVFLGAVPVFWRRNERAALGCLVCGGAELALVLLTDYRGHGKKLITFPVHRQMDYGLAAMTASMPQLLGFKSDREARFFRFKGALTTLVGELTKDSKARPARRSRAA